MTAATIRIEPDDFDRAMIVYTTRDGRTASFETSRRPDGSWEPIDVADAESARVSVIASVRLGRQGPRAPA